MGLGLARRAGRMFPLARILLVGELAVLAGRHVARLQPDERARLLALMREAHGRPSSLAELERDELVELVARMEPQAFIGTAVGRLSPIWVPRRLVESGANAVGRALGGRR